MPDSYFFLFYLYDIQNIKKETRYPSWTNLSDGQKPVSFEKDYNIDNEEKQEWSVYFRRRVSGII